MRRFVARPQAVRTDKHALAVDGRVLQIWVLAGPIDRIIMAAKEFSFTPHPRAFVAHGALSHRVLMKS